MILHSKTRPRRKQRVAAGAAAADLGSEVPNLGVARALFVILVLHVAAIAAIFVHNKVTDDDPVVMKSSVQDGAKLLAVGLGEEPVAIAKQQGEDYYFVATGDTYDKIARSKGVDVTALKQLNSNVALRAGRILRLPTEAAVPAAAQVPARPAPPVVMDPPRPVYGRPVVVERAPAPVVEVARATIVEEEPPALVVVREEELVKVMPNVATPVMFQPEPVRAKVVEAGVSDSGIRHKVKSGDSIWGITRKYKVSQADLLGLNGIADPNKLRLGMELKIPAN
jgi:LysM repeat protein